MRSLIVTENVTVDGVMDLAGGWFDPMAEDVDQSDITAANTEHRGLLMRCWWLQQSTFEAFRGFWPDQTDDPTGISDYLNGVDKYVVSSTLEDPSWRTRPSCAAIWSRRNQSKLRAATLSRPAACSWCTP